MAIHSIVLFVRHVVVEGCNVVYPAVPGGRGQQNCQVHGSEVDFCRLQVIEIIPVFQSVQLICGLDKYITLLSFIVT